MPQLGVGVKYFFRNPNRYNQKETELTMVAGVNLKIPLSHGRAKKHKATIAKLNNEIAQLNLEKNKRLITLEVSQLYYKLQESIQKIEKMGLSTIRLIPRYFQVF